MPPNSENIEALLCAYIEGDLDETGRAEIERYLQANSQHRKLIEELSQTRDMVRGLPRASAPAELADSLRGHMERSLLLGDTPVGRDAGTLRIRRWPQIMALAAVFLLALGLAAVVYQVVIPTFRPPNLTQVAIRHAEPPPEAAQADRMAAAAPDRLRDTSEPGKPDATVTDKTETLDLKTVAHGIEVTGTRNPGVDFDSLANLPDAQAINQRLSGSGISLQEAGHPIVLVISSAMPTMASNQVTEFLDSNKIAWEPVPAASTGNTGTLDVTVPEQTQKASQSAQNQSSVNSDEHESADNSASNKGSPNSTAQMQKNAGNYENQMSPAMGKDSDQSLRQAQSPPPAPSTPSSPMASAPPTTQPASAAPAEAAVANGAVTMSPNADDAKKQLLTQQAPGGNLYVARGMTREQAQQLRASLSQNAIGQQCRFYGDVGTIHDSPAGSSIPSLAEKSPTTNPSPGNSPLGNTSPGTESTDMGRILAPSTQPILDRVDLLIVVQNAVSATAPTTLPVGN